MTNHTENDLRRRMEDAASLPPDDPSRQEVLRRIEEAGTWAEQQWLELLMENEQVRLALRHIQPPQGLEEELLLIPSPTVPRRWFTRTRLLSRSVAATYLLLAVGFGLIWLQHRPPLSEATQHLAMLAIRDHVKRPELTVQSTDRSEIEARLKPLAAFPISIPTLNSGYELVGGRVCKFDSRPIISTRWQYRGRDHSLYQVRLGDFDLPREFVPQVVTAPSIPPNPGAHRVVIWSDGQCAFALVCVDGQKGHEPPNDS
ncbi:MAG: hypothetical protein IIB99_02535 [Planctomycetes bacterium]|nr:hypothetical protein [Planctomycetota bacterium]